MKPTCVIVLFLSTSCLVSCDKGEPPDGAAAPTIAPSTAPHVNSSTFIGVDELMRNTDRYRGDQELVVEGVVSAVGDGELAIIDCGEWDECGVLSCAELTLPVQWSGIKPKTEQRVRLHGLVRETVGKLVFVATRLDIVQTSGDGDN